MCIISMINNKNPDIVEKDNLTYLNILVHFTNVCVYQTLRSATSLKYGNIYLLFMLVKRVLV